MPTIHRRDLVLLLLGVSPDGGSAKGLGGITRLQKFLFLLQEEEHIVPQADGFEFTPYKAGPYSSKLYDDLEFLENLGLIHSEVAAEATAEEAAEVDLLNFEELVTDSAEGTAADAYEEHRFWLSPTGKSRMESLLSEENYQPFVEGIRKIKSKFGNHSLQDLLYYVYTKYPQMATESEIKDQVLSRRRTR